MDIAAPISARLNGRCGGRWYGMWVSMPRRRNKVNTKNPNSSMPAAVYERTSVRCLLRNMIANTIFKIQRKPVITSVREIKKFVTRCLLLD
jgi:hypothetical protein